MHIGKLESAGRVHYFRGPFEILEVKRYIYLDISLWRTSKFAQASIGSFIVNKSISNRKMFSL